MQYTTMDSHVTTFCRACLTSKQDFTYFIHENLPQHIYSFCTSIEIPEDDQLTKAICNGCYEALIKFSQFKHTCIESNNKLVALGEHDGYDSQSNGNDHYEDQRIVMNDVEVKSELNADDYNNLFSALLIDKKVLIKEQCLTEEEHKRKKKAKKKKVKSQKIEVKAKRSKKQFNFSCGRCNKKFVDTDRYEAHILMHEGQDVTIQCKPCSKTFSTWSGLRRHKEIEHTVVSLDSLRCQICGKISKSRQTLRMHEQSHLQRECMICDVCGRECSSRVILKVHLKTHEENRPRPHECNFCDSKFFSKGALSAHTTRRHTDKRYMCNECNYSFTDKYTLSRHFLIHEGKKLHSCDLCQKAFTTRSTLVEHKRVHSGEKPYSCTCCAKQFISKRRLDDHHRTHTGEKPHKCHLCTQAFTQRGTLKRHIKVHEKNAPILSQL